MSVATCRMRDLRSFLGLTAAEAIPDRCRRSSRDSFRPLSQKSWADPVVGATASHQLCDMAFRFLSNPTHIRWDVEENYCRSHHHSKLEIP